MTTRHLTAAVLAMALILAGGCDRSSTAKDDYEATLASARQLPRVQRFNEVFPNSRNFVSYYDARAGQTEWNSEAGIGGRFVLTMKFDLTLDKQRRAVVSTGSPTYYFAEVELIELAGERARSIRFSGSQELSESVMRRLLDSGGDIIKSEIPVKAMDPVEHFELAWEQGAM